MSRLKVKQGNGRKFTLSLVDASNNFQPMDLSGEDVEVFFMAKENLGDEDQKGVIDKSTTIEGIEIDDPQGGVIILTIEPNDTVSLNPLKKYVADIMVRKEGIPYSSDTIELIVESVVRREHDI